MKFLIISISAACLSWVQISSSTVINSFISFNVCSSRRPQCSVRPIQPVTEEMHSLPSKAFVFQFNALYSTDHLKAYTWRRTEGNLREVLLCSVWEGRKFEWWFSWRISALESVLFLCTIPFSHTMSMSTPNGETKHGKHAGFMDGSYCVCLHIVSQF
jgi:hypothetical protein